MHFDRFDICEAYYLYASLYNRGQWSETYKILGKLNNMKFKPSPMIRDHTCLTENSVEIYDNLVVNGYKGE